MFLGVGGEMRCIAGGRGRGFGSGGGRVRVASSVSRAGQRGAMILDKGACNFIRKGGRGLIRRRRRGRNGML